MPKQMKGGSFSIRPGRQARLSQKVIVNTRETRFQPANAWPVLAMYRGIEKAKEGSLAESWEERADQSGL